MNFTPAVIQLEICVKIMEIKQITRVLYVIALNVTFSRTDVMVYILQ